MGMSGEAVPDPKQRLPESNSLSRSSVTTILLLLVLALVAWTILTFNRFTRLRNQTRAAWADIDVQLTRRHDLVPQLVSAVQGHVGHERGTLTAVTELRAQAIAREGPAELGEVEAALEQALHRLFVLREAYPELKASESFTRLQRDLVSIEDQLQYARRFYNGAVRDHNTALQRIPDLLVARVFGFRDAEFYQAGDEPRSPVSVEVST
jgi:LemA protein